MNDKNHFNIYTVIIRTCFDKPTKRKFIYKLPGKHIHELFYLHFHFDAYQFGKHISVDGWCLSETHLSIFICRK